MKKTTNIFKIICILCVLYSSQSQAQVSRLAKGLGSFSLSIALGSLGHAFYQSTLQQGNPGPEISPPPLNCRPDSFPKAIEPLRQISKANLLFSNHDKATVSPQSQLLYPVNLEELARGHIFHHLVYKDHSSCELYQDQSQKNHQDCLSLESKTAAFIKGTHPRLFHQDFFRQESFIKNFYPTAVIDHDKEKEETNISQQFFLGPIKLGSIQLKMNTTELQEQQILELQRDQQESSRANILTIYPNLRTILKADSELGTPHHVQIIDVHKSNLLLERALIVNKFYHFQSEHQEKAEDHTLAITYQTTLIRKADLPAPLWMIKGQLISGSTQEITNVSTILRQSAQKAP